ncbi:MAG TPA: XRE family transcriptional regulator [Pseudonocardiaceae bacterium]|nr:XRE family transcriptional regulator [Pseudonocardiaceae bacterium]
MFSQAAQLYEPSWRLPQAPELSQDSWLPEQPIALEEVKLDWEPNPPEPMVTGQEPEVSSLLPLRTRRQTFPSYSSAIRYLDPPELFENRPCYRLLGASLGGPGEVRFQFGQSCFFDKIDVAEPLVHEFCVAAMNATPYWPELPFRSLIADPFDLALRAVNTSINTLTIRREPDSGRASFFLLRRNPARVVTGGGLYCLIPAGEFQPASMSPGSLLSDLSIWRNIVREYSEELLRQPEHDGSTGRPLAYQRWPFFRAMQKARERGELRVYVLGVTLNALSLNAAVVTVAVIDSVIFDALFHELTHSNAEGEVMVHLGNDKQELGLTFDETTVNHLLHRERLASPNVQAALSLAWQHRATLLEA